MTLRRVLYTLFLTLAAFSLAACVEENPTDVGDVLLPGGDLLTFEVVLPASAFLVEDSSFIGYAKAFDAQFTLIARQLDNTVDANALMRFLLAPPTISVRNSAGTVVADSSPRFFAGRLVLKFDTIAVQGTKPAKLALFHTAQEWDASATWLLRVDSGTVHLPWTTPGGTRGSQIDTVTWVSGDSVVFRVDSATLAAWNDTTNKSRGALFVSETNGSELRVISTALAVSAHSTIRPDTVVEIGLVPAARTFLFTPTPVGPFGGLRAGGIPSWRGIVRLRSDLMSLSFPCNNGQPSCTVPLDSAHLNLAQLLLKPAKPPAGFAPEDTTFVQVRTLSVTSSVPLERSPTGGQVAVTTALAPDLFRNPAPTDVVKLDITSYLAHLLDPNVSAANRLSNSFALIQMPEASTFGFVQFDAAPLLRLVLTTATERR